VAARPSPSRSPSEPVTSHDTSWGHVLGIQRTPRPSGHGVHRYVRRSGRTNTSSSIATLQRSTFVFAQASPHAMILSGLKCPLEALFADITAAAYDLGLFDLQDGGTRVADGEEELRILIEACRLVAPVHGDTPSLGVAPAGRPVWPDQRAVTPWFQHSGCFTRATRRGELSDESHGAYAVAVTSPGRPSGTARNLLLVVAVIVTLEGATFGVLAVLELFSVSSDRVGLGIAATLFLGVVAAGLLWAAWRVVAGDAWARSPLVFAQLIQLGLAWNLRGDPAWLSPAVALPALVVLACLLSPPVTRALRDDQAV
jgi:hypothetical protein